MTQLNTTKYLSQTIKELVESFSVFLQHLFVVPDRHVLLVNLTEMFDDFDSAVEAHAA
jgi:hypothetical protein